MNTIQFKNLQAINPGNGSARTKMNLRQNGRTNGRSEKGQTLIIAMIVLGLLLILGFVFLGIVDGNIKGGGAAKTRSQSNDLAQAGIQFAQQQLLTSPAGADWRGTPTTFSPVSTSGTGVNYTLDPDAYYLRGAPTDSSGNPLHFPGNAALVDLGGPDGLGPFIRIFYDSGRALVRVRYGPSDANIFSAYSSVTGPLIYPGKVHNYLIIEALGRQGVINLNDPTTLVNPANIANKTGFQFQGYDSISDLQTALVEMKQFDSTVVNSRYLRALNTTGLLDNALFITNKFNVSRPADIGYPNPILNGKEVLAGTGIDFNQVDVGSLITMQTGSSTTVAGVGRYPVPTGFGSLFANCDVTFHGDQTYYLNETLGDGLRVAGNIQADDNAVLNLSTSTLVPTTGAWNQNSTSLTANEIDSRSNAFTTSSGLLLDGESGTDASGNPRGVGRLVPPSILQVDPQTGTNRYLALTRDTMGAAGAQGHGNGIYVANTKDIQAPTDEQGRAGAGSNESVLYDWLNPGNGGENSGWQGPFYTPIGAVLRLRTNGFTIKLDNGFWPGLNTDTLEYRIGRYNGQLTIVDSSQDPADINGASGVQYSKGQAFNGVLYFEGNVRIRGQIPTDCQLTVVSGANVYIEGSITKGVVGNDVTASYPASQGGDGLYAPFGQILTRPSRSALMLMAREYVAVNPTMFVGLDNNQPPTVVNDQSVIGGYNPVSIPANGSQNLDLVWDLLLDPTSGSEGAPSGEMPYAMEYTDSVNKEALTTQLLLSQAEAQGSGSATMIGMNINPGYGSIGSSQFFFPGSPGIHLPADYPTIDNLASNYLVLDGKLAANNSGQSVPEYGLAGEATYPRYQSRGFDIVYPETSEFNRTDGTLTSKVPGSDPFTTFALLAPSASPSSVGQGEPGTNHFVIQPSFINGVVSNDYVLARAALVPGDVRIEASIFAEEGSFVVIPGPWFNPNSADSREAYLASGTTAEERNQIRYTQYGNAPEVPFYGEPIDVRIQIVGSVSENMPPPLAVQTQEYQKWGWIPVPLGASGHNIPSQHLPQGTTSVTTASVVPNMIISYDPDIATGRIKGFSNDNSPGSLIRTDSYGRPLLPMPRLPVSPALTFFGDMQ